MARPRDRRRFGPGPYLLGLRRIEDKWGDGFPYDAPAVDTVEQLRLDSPVTLLRGFLDAPERYPPAALED